MQTSPEKNVNNFVKELVSVALIQNELSGLSEMLKCISQFTNSTGCVIWEVRPGSRPFEEMKSGTLFALAQWFPANPKCLPNLPIEVSITGEAILQKKTINVPGSKKHAKLFAAEKSTIHVDAEVMCSVPINFIDKSNGAINFYRTLPISFSEQEVAQIEELVKLVPDLYNTIRDKVSLGLIQSINNILHAGEPLSRATPLSINEVKTRLQMVCDQISKTFQCIETSIFLENRSEKPEVYQLMASTWPRPIKRISYTKVNKKTLTGWVLFHCKSLRIFDLVHFEREKQTIQQQYPGVKWNDSVATGAAIRAFLKISSTEELPPVSFLACPILLGDKVVGTIRCCAINKGPYYFADRELKLLEIIAVYISHYWNNWQRQLEMEEENQSWRSLIDNIGKLNSYVYRELRRDSPDERRIFAEALRITKSFVKQAEIMDIRLLDEEKQELYFFETYGKAWSEGTPEEIMQRRQRRFNVHDKPPKSAGAYVSQNPKLYLIADVEKDRYYSETFPSTKSMILAPINIEDNFFGVLDVRNTGTGIFPRYTQILTELLGKQFALYHFLTTIIGKLRKIETELKTYLREQTQTYQDLAHQLKSPINQAYIRISNFLKTDQIDERLRKELLAARGLCGKAKRVSMNTGLFASLARGEPIPFNASRLYYDDLVRKLIEAAVDYKVLSEPEHNLDFWVDKSGFESLLSKEIQADIDLIEQAVNCVLDNAMKYSFSRTLINIFGGFTKTGRFHISVTNKGIKISSEEIKECSRRYYRSEGAKSTTGEGTGIGLWIVDHIMKRHGGELLINPTTPDGLTEVKMIFG